jgi:hypothetical protein
MNYAQAGRKTRLFFYGYKMSAGLQPSLGWNFPLLVFIRVKRLEIGAPGNAISSFPAFLIPFIFLRE